MTEATWGDATKTPDIDWSMSAALENVTRGGEDIAEVASLRMLCASGLGLIRSTGRWRC